MRLTTTEYLCFTESQCNENVKIENYDVNLIIFQTSLYILGFSDDIASIVQHRNLLDGRRQTDDWKGQKL